MGQGPVRVRGQECGCGEGCVDRENDEWGPTVIEAKMAKIGHFTQLARWGFEPGSIRYVGEVSTTVLGSGGLDKGAAELL